MTNTALCLMGSCLLLLARQFVVEQDHFVIGFSGVSGWSAWVYVAAVLVVLTQPVDRATFWIVIGFAIAFQATTLFRDPYLSTDVYRYVWDGVVQHAHVNPYRYVPADPALRYLQAPNQDVYDNINRRDYARTIYPPVAQMIYWLATWFAPTVTAMKAMMVAFEGLTTVALVALLRAMGRPRTQVLLFAWCPLLVWEIAGSGHLDAAVFGLVTLALLFRWRGQPVLTGLFLGMAVMTKFYPLVLLPALWMRKPEARGLRRLGEWQLPAVMAAVCVLGYGVYLSAGSLVFGFLFGYTREEGIDSGARFFLLDLVKSLPGLGWVPTPAFELFAAAVLGAIAWWAWRFAAPERMEDQAPGDTPRFLKAAWMLALAMMLLFSPHYPWYIVWLIPFFALTPNLPLLVYLMAFFYGFTTAYADPGPKMFLLNKVLYAVVAVTCVLHLLLRRWSLRQMLRLEGEAAL